MEEITKNYTYYLLNPEGGTKEEPIIPLQKEKEVDPKKVAADFGERIDAKLKRK